MYTIYVDTLFSMKFTPVSTKNTCVHFFALGTRCISFYFHSTRVWLPQLHQQISKMSSINIHHIYGGKMKQIFLEFGSPKATVASIMILYKDTKAMVPSHDGNTDLFDIVTEVFQRKTIVPFPFIIWFDTMNIKRCNISFFNELNCSVVDLELHWQSHKFLKPQRKSPGLRYISNDSFLERTHIQWEYVWGSQFSHMHCIGRM